jgi:Na+-driven multidrug efflux pump
MQLPAAVTFVTDGILMGANDFRDLRWSTTLAFFVGLPVFVAVMLRPSLGIVTVWLGVLLFIAARALKNHTRVQGDTWMRSADAVA